MKKLINIALVISQSLLVFLFAYTSISKLLSFRIFRNALSHSPVIGTYASLVGYALPALELFVAVLLLLPSAKRMALYISFVLLMIMTVYLGVLVLLTPHLPCACGGVISQLSWKQHIVLNCFFLLLNAFLIIKNQQQSREYAENL
jgi:hypothetical protein